MKLSRVFLKGYVACPVLKLDIIALLLQSSWYRCREALEVILSDKAILSQMKVFHQKIDTVWNFHLITFDWLCFHLAILVNKCCLAGKASCALKQATQASLSLQVMILCSVKMNSCSLDTWSTSPALHRAGRKFFFFTFLFSYQFSYCLPWWISVLNRKVVLCEQGRKPHVLWLLHHPQVGCTQLPR